MGLDNMKSPESNGQKLENLSAQEVLDKYSSKVTEKGKADKYLDRVKVKDAMFKGVSVQDLSREIIRYIGDRNQNIDFGKDADLSTLPKDEVYAYIAYAQDMLGLEVDGLLGDKTMTRLANIYKAREEVRLWALKEADKMIKREESLQEKTAIVDNLKTESDEVGRTVGIPDIQKAEGAKRAENFRFNSPDLKGVSKENLAEQTRKLENLAEFRQVRNQIPNLLAKYDMEIEGGTAELKERARAKKDELLKFSLYMDQFDEGLQKGYISLSDFAVVIGMEIPKDLE